MLKYSVIIHVPLDTITKVFADTANQLQIAIYVVKKLPRLITNIVLINAWELVVQNTLKNKNVN